MLCRWNHIIYNLWELSFSLSIILWEFIFLWLFCVSVLCALLLLSSITCYECKVCLAIHPLKDIWVTSSFWLFKQSCYEHLCTGFCVNISLFLSDKCPEMQLLGCMVVAYLAFLETASCFWSGYTILHSHQQCMNDPVSLYYHQLSGLLLFSILAVLMGIW